MGKICDLLDLILQKDNLNEAYKQVKRNKGKGGIIGLPKETENSIIVVSK